jgi:flagellar biosynthesis/type III secretory pathway chaperone
MNDTLSHLIESLREELKQYGEMLVLLDQQQDHVLHRRPDALLQSVDAVNAQAEAIHAARQEREQHRRHLARTLALNPDAGFLAMLPMLPVEYRMLIEALVRENNELLVRIKQRARQNHLLLSRAMELMQQFINALAPLPAATTYSHTGVVPAANGLPHSSFEALV